MTKLMTISTLAAVLSMAIATNANAFPPYAPPSVHVGDADIGGAYGYGGKAFVGGAAPFAGTRAGHFQPDVHHDVWGHWGDYYGPMVHAP